jgi:polyisoprenyl-phosphate glycosyltransferase
VGKNQKRFEGAASAAATLLMPLRDREISVVVPVYKCAECLRHLHGRLAAALAQVPGEHEIVLVDDRSPDDSWRILRQLAEEDRSIRVVRLSRNFGQHAAITAGIEFARGRWIVVMDCDLQDPPEDIPRLYARAQEGAEIVYARRTGRRGPWFRRIASRAYFRLLNASLGTNFDPDYGNFTIISRKVRDAFLRFRDKDRHYLMILRWLGFDHASIDVAHADRYAGESAYTLRTLLRFATDGLFFQSTTLLRWSTYIGFTASLGGVVLAAFFFVNYFFENTYPGWTSLAVLILVIGGVTITTVGVAGLYIGKIFTQVKDRPLYVVDDVLQAARSPDSASISPLVEPEVEHRNTTPATQSERLI